VEPTGKERARPGSAFGARPVVLGIDQHGRAAAQRDVSHVEPKRDEVGT
jgi:hypothetical protein